MIVRGIVTAATRGSEAALSFLMEVNALFSKTSLFLTSIQSHLLRDSLTKHVMLPSVITRRKVPRVLYK